MLKRLIFNNRNYMVRLHRNRISDKKFIFRFLLSSGTELRLKILQIFAQFVSRVTKGYVAVVADELTGNKCHI